jgi:predicted transcriptional regulator
LELGDLEAEVIKAVKLLERGSASEVMDVMKRSRDVAYTTVSTTLDRLYRKKLLTRQTATGRGGTRYIYEYPRDRTPERRIVTRTVDKLVRAFGPSAISNIYRRLDELSGEESAEIKREIERRKKNK